MKKWSFIWNRALIDKKNFLKNLYKRKKSGHTMSNQMDPLL